MRGGRDRQGGPGTAARGQQPVEARAGGCLRRQSQPTCAWGAGPRGLEKGGSVTREKHLEVLPHPDCVLRTQMGGRKDTARVWSVRL